MSEPRWLLWLLFLLVFGPGTTFASAPVLTLEQKVGQLFLIGFPEKTFNPKVGELLKAVKPGGLILFRRNLGDIGSIRSFTEQLREESLKVSGVAPFLAVDQEGGPVARVPIFPPLPSAHSVGRAGREDLSLGLGEETGKILRWVGFNMNFAPVLDLSDPFKPSFIGPRSFGDSPELTGKLGLSFAEGLRRHGVLPTAKHFPGLGATTGDPHRRTVKQTASRETFLQRDLKPFALYATLGPNVALMVSQLSYPSLDESGMPAPFSKKILSGLLRRELKYRGLIVTDDLQMKGTATILSPDEAALRSLMAGTDMVMLSWSADDQKKAFDRVLRAVRSGEWPLTELEDRVQRILSIKRALDSFSEANVLKIGRGPEGEPATRALENIDLALLDSNLRAQPLSPTTKEPVCVVAAQNRFLDSYRQGSRIKPQVFLINQQTSARDLDRALSSCSRVVFAVSGRKTAHLLSGLSVALLKKTFTVNLGLPSLIDSKIDVAGRVEVGYPHLHAGYRIAQRFQNLETKRSDRAPANVP